MSRIQTPSQKSEPSRPTDDRAAFWARPNHEILADLRDLFEADGIRSAKTIISRLRGRLRAYEEATGCAPSSAAFLTDVDLQAAVLASDASLRGGGRISAATARGVLYALRALTAALRPLPPGVTRDELRDVHDRAVRLVSEQHGLRFTLRVGERRPRSPRYVPALDEVKAVVQELRRGTGADPVVAEFVEVAVATDLRISEVLGLRVGAVTVRPGLVTARLHTKGNDALHSVALPRHLRVLETLGQAAPDAPLWMHAGRALTVRVARDRVRRACERLRARPFTPHALRAVAAREVDGTLGLETAQRVGRWRSETVAEQHYIAPKDGGPR